MRSLVRLLAILFIALAAGYFVVWTATWSVRLSNAYGAPIPVGTSTGALLASPGDSYSADIFALDVLLTAGGFLVIARWGVLALIAALFGAALGIGLVFGMLALAYATRALSFFGFPVPITNALPGGPSLALWLDALIWGALAAFLVRWWSQRRSAAPPMP